MLLFIASLMAYLIDKTLFNSSIGLIVIVSFCLAIGLYLVIVLDNKFSSQKKEIEEILKKQEEESENAEPNSTATEQEKIDVVTDDIKE
jgi:predicted Holliday junction resolvase-like endonuclease